MILCHQICMKTTCCLFVLRFSKFSLCLTKIGHPEGVELAELVGEEPFPESWINQLITLTQQGESTDYYILLFLAHYITLVVCTVLQSIEC
jgi:hypothetical protein